MREGLDPGGVAAEVDGRLVGGRYRLIRALGTGGMGSVYLCEHVALGRRYALKLLPTGQVRDQELVGRFRQEAQAASRIDQENVVDVVDFGQDERGDLYYVMEFVEGRTLTTLMRQDGPLPLPRALLLLEQACRALAAAHAAGVVHRDVKPDNLLVERLADGTERVKLIDFGISHVPSTGRLTRAGEIIGTPEYMAPEQASGQAIDELTDVYAAGVLAFELLTGSLPLQGPTAIATLVAHQTVPPPRPSMRRSALPPEVDALVLRALSKDKSLRVPSMQAFAAEVMRLRVSASLAAVSGRGEPGGWSSDGAGTGRGGTIGLAAVPYPESPPDGPAPILPSPGTSPQPEAPPGQEGRGDPAAGRRRALVLGVAAVGFAGLLVVSLWGLLSGAPPAPGAIPAPAMAAPQPPAAIPPAAAPLVPPPEAAPAPSTEAAPAPAPEAPAPERAAPRPAPARRADPLRDPYATPADPLKPDPFR